MNFCFATAFLAVLLLAPLSASAADDAVQRADWDARLAVAKEKQARGSQMKQAAKKAFDAEQRDCYKRFRVTDCQQESRLRFNQALKEARAHSNEGDAEERQVRKEQRDDKDARYAAEAPQRAADLKAREARVSSERSAMEAQQAQRLADKAAQAKAGAQRRARDAERQRQKQEAHERKVQQKLEEAALRPSKPAKVKDQGVSGDP